MGSSGLALAAEAAGPEEGLEKYLAEDGLVHVSTPMAAQGGILVSRVPWPDFLA
jgi:hypothetical protein